MTLSEALAASASADILEKAKSEMLHLGVRLSLSPEQYVDLVVTVAMLLDEHAIVRTGQLAQEAAEAAAAEAAEGEG